MVTADAPTVATPVDASEVHIRYQIRCDMPEVLQIERASFGEFAWTEEDFLHCQRQRNCIGMVAEQRDGKVVGYMFYELHDGKLHIVKFAVAPDVQGTGVDAQMVAKLVSKLKSAQTSESKMRNRITVIVPADREDGIDFFLGHGFVLLHSLPGYYPTRESGEDALFLRYVLPGETVEDDDLDVCPDRLEVLSMQSQHLDAVATIALENFPYGWMRGDFRRCLEDSGCTNLVAVMMGFSPAGSQEKEVLGFLVCATSADRTVVEIRNMAVAPAKQDEDVGTELIAHLQSTNPARILVEVSVHNEIALAFLKVRGFKITKTVQIAFAPVHILELSGT